MEISDIDHKELTNIIDSLIIHENTADFVDKINHKSKKVLTRAWNS